VKLFDRLGAQSARILGIFRVLAGVMFACHGAQKILGAFGGIPPEHMNALTRTAGIIELVGGALIALGLFTRPAAFLCSGLMAFAYFIGHAGQGFFPKANGGEPAVLYCWIFLYFAAQGPGAFALDGVIGRKMIRSGGGRPQ
jgi:putative oxidoreductase